MLPKVAYLLDDQIKDAERRGATRRRVYLSSSPDDFPLGRRIVLLDLSESGFRMQCGARLHVGQTVGVNLPRWGEVEAEIVWRNNDEYGARFETPITKAVVSAAILASPEREHRQDSPIERPVERTTSIPPIYGELALLMLLPVVALFLIVFAILPISGW